MYKRLYLGREVPPDRHSHILDTHDIEGAQPRSWVHPDRPFFAKNYPEIHLATQNQQYNDALHQRLLYNKKQNETEWKASKKCDYPDAKAKNSEISREQLINRKEDFEDVRRAKELFYARNLRVDDIEGTKPGTLDTKFMKNWALAQELKKAEADGLRKKPDPQDNIFQKPRGAYPYGDGMNGEDYLPENLRHAREMAHRNRNRLRAEAVLNPAHQGRNQPGQVRPDQRTSMASLMREQPQQMHNLQNQMTVSQPHLSFQPRYDHSSEAQRGVAPPAHHHDQSRHQFEGGDQPDNHNHQSHQDQPDHRLQHPESSAALAQQIEEEERKLRWIREQLRREAQDSQGQSTEQQHGSAANSGEWQLHESQEAEERQRWRDQEVYQGDNNRQGQSSSSLPPQLTHQGAKYTTGGFRGEPGQMKQGIQRQQHHSPEPRNYGQSPTLNAPSPDNHYQSSNPRNGAPTTQGNDGQRHVHFEQRPSEEHRSHPSHFQPNHPEAYAPDHQGTSHLNQRRTNTENSHYGLSPKEQEQFFHPEVLNNPPREMFANQHEQASYDR